MILVINTIVFNLAGVQNLLAVLLEVSWNCFSIFFCGLLFYIFDLADLSSDIF